MIFLIYRYRWCIMDSEVCAQGRAYRISAFLVDGRPRFLFQNVETLEPSIAVSLWEQSRSLRRGSYNSVKNDLKCLLYLYDWAQQKNIDLDYLLLNGLALSASQTRTFGAWLNEYDSGSKDKPKKLGVANFNRVLDVSASLFAWFISNFPEIQNADNQQLLERQQVIQMVEKLFRSQKVTDKKKRFAGDLSEEEIEIIEKYLKPANRTDAEEPIVVRDYLIWRLAIEFGFREGEILALRLEDLPRGKQQCINIVRIEERGDDYHDPRGVYMPRPKTLSRELGFILDHSEIPRLLGNYMSYHRCTRVERNGKLLVQPILDHNFLIVNHRRKDGLPLTESGMRKIAGRISRQTGVKFHWHVARHAFFNRAYAALAGHPELKDKVMDLVHWGGWSSEKSLRLYINRARNERAKTALTFWQLGMNQWDALK